jgi:hypothetical protein
VGRYERVPPVRHTTGSPLAYLGRSKIRFLEAARHFINEIKAISRLAPLQPSSTLQISGIGSLSR